MLRYCALLKNHLYKRFNEIGLFKAVSFSLTRSLHIKRLTLKYIFFISNTLIV